MAVERKSNIELLRLLCMFMIFLNHMIGHGVLQDNPIAATGAGRFFFSLGSSLWVPAALVFVLISGYFGIRPSWRGAVKYVFVCTFYMVLCTAVGGGKITV